MSKSATAQALKRLRTEEVAQKAGLTAYETEEGRRWLWKALNPNDTATASVGVPADKTHNIAHGISHVEPKSACGYELHNNIYAIVDACRHCADTAKAQELLHFLVLYHLLYAHSGCEVTLFFPILQVLCFLLFLCHHNGNGFKAQIRG